MGGSGGVVGGKVEGVVLGGRGHFLCMEGKVGGGSKVGAKGAEVVGGTVGSEIAGAEVLVDSKEGKDIVAEKSAAWIGKRLKEEREVDAWWRAYQSSRSEGGEGWRVSAMWEREVKGKADMKRVGAKL